MNEIGDAVVCPHCGYIDDGLQTSPYLPTKTWLMDRYYIGKIKTIDAEGVTYMGWDNILQSAILVREFLPAGLCVRVNDGQTLRPREEAVVDYSRLLTEFLERCRTLARMRDLAALFPTYDIFECNGTAYAVSEYTESITLSEFLHRNGDTLTFGQTRTLMLPAISTLSALHDVGIFHCGISPETLYVGKDGRLRFGGFADRELRTVRGVLEPNLYPCYAAIEQYGFDGKIGAHTDVYAFAAVIYRVLSGVAPTEAKARMNQDTVAPATQLADKAPDYAVKALTNALQLLPDSRTATMEGFRSEFSAAPTVKAKEETQIVTEDSFTPVPIETSKKKNNSALIYTLVAMGVTLLVLLAIFLVMDAKWHVFGLFKGEDETVSSAPLLVSSSEEAPSVNTQQTLTRKVPDFAGQTLSTCESNYTSYSFKVDYKRYDEANAEDTIISQDPPAGTEIPLDDESTQITVVVSLGSAKAPIPKVEGLTYARALEALWEAGFSYDSITCNTDNPAFDGIVTKVAPGEGTPCSFYDADIVLYVENPVSENSEAVPETSEENKEVASIDQAPEEISSKPQTQSKPQSKPQTQTKPQTQAQAQTQSQPQSQPEQ
jgi:serine/threonine-protein kinase